MKNIIVVTGASSGMGREFVKQISAKEKVDEIWVIARRIERLELLKNEVDIPIKPIALDLTKQNDIKKYAYELESEKPNIKILCNASGYGKFDHFENIDLETHLDMIDLNSKAVVSMTSYSLPYMNKGSKIINLCSCSAFFPIPYINIYAATKAFILSFSRALNRELKYRGIHVLAVCPYWVKTEFFDRAVEDNKKKVIQKYDVLYNPDEVIKKAIKDLYSKKDVSIYGFKNKFQAFLLKILPHKVGMSFWMKRENLNGTPEIR